MLCCLGSTNGRSIFDDLPPIITDQSNSNALTPSTHQFLFQPIGKFATDVHYMHIHIPFYLTPVFKSLSRVQKAMTSIVSLTSAKGSGPVIAQIASETLKQNKIIYDNFVNLVSNLPTHDISQYHRKKLFFDILFGLTGTVFGIANSIAIASINTKIAKNIKRTDLLVDISQIHDNHLKNIDDQIHNIAGTLRDFVTYSPTMVSSVANTMSAQILKIVK